MKFFEIPKKYLFLTIIIVAQHAFGQNETHSISSHFGYGFGNQTSPYSITKIKETFDAGIEYRRRIFKSDFYIQTGLRLNEFGNQWFEYDWVEGYGLSNSININGIIHNKFSHYSLAIPAIITYKFKKFIPGLTLSAGPQCSFHLALKRKVNDDVEYVKMKGAFPINLSANFSIGYEKKIAEKWIIGIAAYSNLNYLVQGWQKLTSKLHYSGYYNCGISLNGRYILN